MSPRPAPPLADFDGNRGFQVRHDLLDERLGNDRLGQHRGEPGGAEAAFADRRDLINLLPQTASVKKENAIGSIALVSTAAGRLAGARDDE